VAAQFDMQGYSLQKAFFGQVSGDKKHMKFRRLKIKDTSCSMPILLGKKMNKECHENTSYRRRFLISFSAQVLTIFRGLCLQ